MSAAIRDTLHWLSFPQRSTYKLCLMTHECLHGLALTYLSRYCVPLASFCSWSLSTTFCWCQQTVTAPRTLKSTPGWWSFSVCGPASWHAFRDPDLTLESFCQLLKTALFAANWFVNCTVTTCLENLETSGNLTAVREMSGILLKIREMSGIVGGKVLSGKSCLKLFIVNCIFVSIQVFSRSLLCLKC